MNRLSKNHISTSLYISTRALNCGLLSLASVCIGSRHHNKIAIYFAIDSRFYAIAHLIFAYKLLIWAVSTTFLRDLIFDMASSSTSASELFYRSSDIKRPAPASICINQQRQISRGGNSARINANVF